MADQRGEDGDLPAADRARRVHVETRLVLPVVAVGIGGALAGALYLAVLHLLQRWLWPEGHSAAVQAAILVATGVIVAVAPRVLGPTGGVGLLVDNIHVMGGAEDLRQTRSMVPISLVCVAAGGAMGPEAPLVQTTGTIGTWWAQRLGLDRHGVRILTITGMAAGFTVLFGAPMGAALFALEILHRRGLQYYEAVLPAMIGSLAGIAVSAVVMRAGLAPIWEFPAAGPLEPTDLAWAVGLGVVGAAGAALFCLAATAGRRLVGHLPAWIVPVVGGAVLAGLGAASPYALTFGEGQVDQLVGAGLSVATLAGALAAKFAGTLTTLVAGWKGGFIIPLFFMGVAGGEIVHAVVPSTNATVVTAALMAALCVGVTKTPLGSTLVVTSMAGIALLPTTLAAAVVALVLTDRFVLIGGQRDRADRPPVEEGPPSPGGAAG